MSNTFSQIYIQVVFAVKNRDAVIQESWSERLNQYITGIIQKKGQKVLAINGMSDHIHIFISINPSCCLSDLVREVKKASHEFIKENQFCRFQFNWQEGYGAFSYSHSQIDAVVKYILTQKEHHTKQSLRDEYNQFLKKYEIPFDEKYLFNWI